MTLAVPALVFTSLTQNTINPQFLSEMIIVVCMAYALVSVLGLIFTFIFKLDLRTFLMPLISGNTGNLGLPLCFLAFGKDGLGYAVIVFAFTSIVAFTFGLWVVSGTRSFKQPLKEPLVPATILGLLFMFYGWETPKILTNALNLIAQMAIPLMLITLGVAVARLKTRLAFKTLGISISKIMIGTIAGIAVGYQFSLPYEAFAVLVIQMSMPVAVTSYLLAEKYGANSEAVAGLVVISTFLTTITTPVLLSFLLI
jgi:predicted permease